MYGMLVRQQNVVTNNKNFNDSIVIKPESCILLTLKE